MNIDKQEMETAYLNRQDPSAMRELLGYFDEMADYFGKKFGIRYPDREEIKQEAMMVAVKAIPKYNPTKKSTPFSYFYKVFNVAFMYHLRKQKMKADRRPKTCSIDAFSNLGTEFPAFVDEDEMVTVGGHNYLKEELVEKTKIGIKLAKRANKLSDDDQCFAMIDAHEDELVKTVARGYIEHKCKR